MMKPRKGSIGVIAGHGVILEVTRLDCRVVAREWECRQKHDWWYISEPSRWATIRDLMLAGF